MTLSPGVIPPHEVRFLMIHKVLYNIE